MGAHGIKEVTVVADHQHRMFKVRKEVLKPFYSVEVEVVGRLVEQQVVGVAIECLSQHDTHLLLTCQFRHHLIVQVFLNAQTRQELGCIALGIPSIEFGKLLLQLCSTDAILVAEVRLGVEGILFLHDFPKHRMTHHHGVDDRAVVELEVVLRKHGEAFARAERDGSFGGFEFTADGFEQG